MKPTSFAHAEQSASSSYNFTKFKTLKSIFRQDSNRTFLSLMEVIWDFWVNRFHFYNL